MNEAFTLVGTLITGLLSGGVLVAWMNRGKTKAETNNLVIHGHLEVVESALAHNKSLMTSNNQLARRLDELTARMDQDRAELLAHINALEEKVEALEKDNKKLRERCLALEKENNRLKDAAEGD